MKADLQHGGGNT